MALPTHPALEGTSLPNYRSGEARGRYTAHFSEGVTVPVTRGRERWYPKLTSTAPCMLAVYEAIAGSLTDEKLVWDVGCGAGAGTRILAATGRTTVGFDIDRDALAFARSFATTETFQQLPTAVDSAAAPDVIVLVDVLGLAERPRALLSALRRLASAKTRLVVVEYRAFCTQAVAPPIKRAFSDRSLRALLVQSGWLLDVVQPLAQTLILGTAFPSAGSEGDLFDAAEETWSRGDLASTRLILRGLALEGPLAVRKQAYLELADLYFMQGDGDSAGEALAQIAGLDADEPAASAGMSRLTLAMGNPADALMLAVQALERDPTDAGASVALAHAAEQAEPSEAANAWAMACNLMPDDVAILTNRARVCAEVGQPELSIAALEQLRTYHPSHGPELSLTLAWLLLEAGRISDAQLEARVAAILGEDDPEVQRVQAAIATASN